MNNAQSFERKSLLNDLPFSEGDTIKLNIEEVDENNLFLTILKNDKNLVSELEICQFSNEMEYWGYPIKLFKYNNIYGYFFTKELDKDDLLFEVERIIKKYKLDA